MNLKDPITAYNAANFVDAQMAQLFLESHGIEAMAVDDHSPAGLWTFGVLPEIHKPQVWISRCDAEQAGQLLAEYEHKKRERDAPKNTETPQTLEAICEECNKPSTFADSLNGTLQECPHCYAYLDVGEFEWPEENAEEADRAEPQDSNG